MVVPPWTGQWRMSKLVCSRYNIYSMRKLRVFFYGTRQWLTNDGMTAHIHCPLVVMSLYDFCRTRDRPDISQTTMPLWKKWREMARGVTENDQSPITSVNQKTAEKTYSPARKFRHSQTFACCSSKTSQIRYIYSKYVNRL